LTLPDISFLQAGIPPVIVAHHKTIEQSVV
jgi:hypothetical protein